MTPKHNNNNNNNNNNTFRYLLCAASVLWMVITFGPMNPFSNPVSKTGRYLRKIKDIEHERSLKKISAQVAADKIQAQMVLIKKQYAKIPAEEKIKEPLGLFLEKWHAKELILNSIADGNQHFMADVTTFFMRGLVEYRSGWRTLFPLFRP